MLHQKRTASICDVCAHVRKSLAMRYLVCLLYLLVQSFGFRTISMLEAVTDSNCVAKLAVA